MTDQRPFITLITGADKGLGFETAKGVGAAGHHVLVGARNAQKGAAAVATLRTLGITADAVQLDVTDHEQIVAAADRIRSQFGYLSVLVNNAGIAVDHHQPASQLALDLARQDMAVNYFGLVDVTQVMLPLLKATHRAKIVNVTSNMGSLGLATDPTSQFFHVNSLGYQASKAAANFATIAFAKELASTGITVNSVNPGWTATGFGGRDVTQAAPAGMQDVATGAARIIKMTLDDSGATGTFTENAGPLPW
ncbi:SDR family NAD(P)-dependent oxidoreductase [Lacticaseibacillus mingshuiensis]|uniref:SDR family NAD(P)-dependent oxidoreductase n=1 Tax=Lacticaseibacillus mingshuiensis TaxID=2799574 RepID=UPI0019520ACB|nr:SDR family NAD(P)-dependent oxidoreductase [Lacticaseibacillus mingshuiensis]